MKLVRLEGREGAKRLALADADPPTPGVGQILVRVRASSLNFHDRMVAIGAIPCSDGLVPMSDGAGEVVAVGDGVDGFAPGDAVVGTFYPDWHRGEASPDLTRTVPGETIDGYAREFACVGVEALTKAPAGWTHLEAATLPCAGVTAWRALVVAGRVKPGDSVLVLGTGGVSLFALQLAKAAGGQVIATTSTDAKVDRLQHLGADHVINYRSRPNWGEEVKSLTGGRGVDHVIEVGGPSTLMQSIVACRMGGHIALVGLLTGFTAELSIPAFFSNQIRMTGISVGSRQDQEDLIRALSTLPLRPVIDRSFSLSEIGEAFDHYGSLQHVGKVCLEL